MPSQNYRALDATFADAFKAARLGATLSQEQVAERMRVAGFEMSQPVVGKIERAERKVTIAEAVALADAVGSRLSSLLLGPDYVTTEILRARLGNVRAEAKAALIRYGQAQQAAAIGADQLARGAGESTNNELLEWLVLEPLEDLVVEVERDNIAENQARRLRDEMDRTEDDEEVAPTLKREGLFWSHQEKFGDRAPGLPDGDVWFKMLDRGSDG